MKRQTEDRINLALNTLIGIAAGIFLIGLISVISCTKEDAEEILEPVPVPLIQSHPAYNLKCGVGHVPYHLPDLEGWGGEIVDVGFDADGDGELYDDNEIQISENICWEIQNGQILVLTELKEDRSGYFIYMGSDLDMNNILEYQEITYSGEIQIPNEQL